MLPDPQILTPLGTLPDFIKYLLKIKIRGVAKIQKEGTHGLCVRETSIDYRKIIEGCCKTEVDSCMVWCCYPEQSSAKGGCRLSGGCTGVQPNSVYLRRQYRQVSDRIPI